MGQLERYGLYVLCLVIFLILGVAIWGGDPAQGAPPAGERNDLVSNGTGEGGDARRSDQDDDRGNAGDDFWRADDGSDEVLGGMRAAEDDDEAKPLGNGGEQKGGGETPPPQPTPLERTHTVQHGDSMAMLAKRYYGSQAFASRIQSANPNVDPRRMPLNTVLRIPGLTPGPDGKQPQRAPMAYKVRSGDTLGEISKKCYGSARFADKIRAANNITDDRRLKIGAKLVIPRLN